MAFQTVEVVYFAVLWTLAFTAGAFRTIRDCRSEYGWNCLSVGVVGGFYGFSTVAILSYYGPSISDFGWGYLGVATAIGALGKEQEQIMRNVLNRFLGISDGKDNKTD